jgi:hypothetical protein
MSDKYILKGHLAVEEPDLLKWANWFEGGARIVRQEDVGPYWVSTVFLGLDHSFGRGRPLLFETMIFRGPASSREDVWMERCGTWEEAEAQHLVGVAEAKRLMEAGPNGAGTEGNA